MNRKKTKLACAALMVGLFVPSMPLFGAEGRIPIWEPVSISENGKYTVTRNIHSSATGTPAIHISAEVVEIDLNGFTVSAESGPVIAASGNRNVVIRNGATAGGTIGIEILSGPAGRGGGVVIENVALLGWSVHGIRIDGFSDFEIRRNTLDGENDAEDAIVVFNTVGSGSIEWNKASGGITVRQAANVAIVHNRLKDVRVYPEADGAIHVDGSSGGIIGWNSIHYVLDGDGIYLVNSEGCEIRENTISMSFQNGIVVEANGNSLIQNVVRSCQLDGVWIRGSGNYLDGNLLTDNGRSGTGWGLHFENTGAHDNTFGRNTSRVNQGSAAACASAPLPAKPPTNEFCDEGSNNSSFDDNHMPHAF